MIQITKYLYFHIFIFYVVLSYSYKTCITKGIPLWQSCFLIDGDLTAVSFKLNIYCIQYTLKCCSVSVQGGVKTDTKLHIYILIQFAMNLYIIVHIILYVHLVSNELSCLVNRPIKRF